MTRKETLAVLERWVAYHAAQAHAATDYPDRSLALSSYQRAKCDLAYLKRGTNWREYHDGTSYLMGGMRTWYAVYPQDVASRRCY